MHCNIVLALLYYFQLVLLVGVDFRPEFESFFHLTLNSGDFFGTQKLTF